jgi:Na+/glutamate symporter
MESPYNTHVGLLFNFDSFMFQIHFQEHIRYEIYNAFFTTVKLHNQSNTLVLGTMSFVAHKICY